MLVDFKPAGSAKGVTAAKSRGRKYVRNHGYGGSTRTEFQASAPRGNGITSAYSKAAAFGDLLTPVASAIDLKADYDAKNGASTKMAWVFYFAVASTKIIAR